MQHRVRLIRKGTEQSVRIPKEFELPGDEAVIRRERGRLIIEPVRRPTLSEVLDSMEPIDEPWPEIEDPPPEPVEI